MAYINGEEVLRYNMPEGAVTHLTCATNDVEGLDEIQFREIEIPTNMLEDLPGSFNVLAVEVHQYTNSSPDLSFDCSLVARHGVGRTDTDADGVPDWWEIQHYGTTNNDASVDSDQDGVGAAEEYAAGTNPWNEDSDSDGTPDPIDLTPAIAGGRIQILWPPCDGVVLTDSVSITGLVYLADSTPTSVYVDIRGATNVVSGSNVFTFTQSLSGLEEGREHVCISLHDASNDCLIAETWVSFTVDAVPPAFSITWPTNGAVVTGQHVRVVAQSEWTTNSTVTINGSPAFRDGVLRYRWVTLNSSGSNDITGVLTDAFGRSVTNSVGFNYTPPEGYEPYDDDDLDGVTNNVDLFPNDPNESADADSDGTGDNADPADDNAVDAGGPIVILYPEKGQVFE